MKDEIRHEVLFVTPTMAMAWLSNPADRQRSVSRLTVDRYAKAMTEGRWVEPTLDPIALTKDGKLLNGQHRLQAIIKHGKKIEMLVAFDVPERVFAVIDSGRRRSAWQFVKTTNAMDQAAAARLVLWYDNRRIADPDRPIHPIGTRAMGFDNDEVLALLEGPLAETFQVSVREASHTNHTTGVPCSVHCALLVIARRGGANPTKLESWLEGVTDGIGLVAGDPRLLLRNRMLDPVHGRHMRRLQPAAWMLTVRAFNAFMQGRTMRNLIYEASDPPPPIDFLGTAVQIGTNVGQKPKSIRRKAEDQNRRAQEQPAVFHGGAVQARAK